MQTTDSMPKAKTPTSPMSETVATANPGGPVGCLGCIHPTSVKVLRTNSIANHIPKPPRMIPIVFNNTFTARRAKLGRTGLVLGKRLTVSPPLAACGRYAIRSRRSSRNGCTHR